MTAALSLESYRLLTDTYKALGAILNRHYGHALRISRVLYRQIHSPKLHYARKERDRIRIVWLLGASRLRAALNTRPRRSRQLREAENHLNDALNSCRRIDMIDHEADILLDRARLQRELGDVAQARKGAYEAMAIADRCGYRRRGTGRRW